MALSALSHRRTTSPGPPSPTFSDATHLSTMRFGVNGPSKIITRSNLKASVQAYEDLLNTCGGYRTALVAMSKATAAFADAMQRCSGLKGPNYESGTRLQAASGVHHLMGNLWHVLAESLDKGFEKPLRQHLDVYKSAVHERSQGYERALHEKSQIIRDTEMRSMNRKERNLQSFREALAVLQRQVDELDELKLAHYQKIVEHEEDVWSVVQGKLCLVVRSTMDVFDRITSKSSDPVLEPMLQCVPDPFDAYGPPQAEDQIFSILSPLSISMNMNNTTPTKALSTSSSSAELSSSMTMVPGITPERDDDVHRKISSWLPGANGATVYEWARGGPSNTLSAKTASPPSSPLRRHSISPALSRHSAMSSSSSSLHRTNNTSPRTRKYSAPALIIRKAETQLRSVISVLEEDKTGLKHEKEGFGDHLESGQNQEALDASSSSYVRLGDTTSSRPDLEGDEINGILPSSRNDDYRTDTLSRVVVAEGEGEGDETPLGVSTSLLFPSIPDLEESTSPSTTLRNGNGDWSVTMTPTAPHGRDLFPPDLIQVG